MEPASRARTAPPPAGVPRPRGLSRWWLNRPVFVKGLLALAVPLFAVILITAAAFSLNVQQQAERRVAIAVNALVSSSAAVLADVVDGETGIRGYAATGDPAFLEPYTTAQARLETDIDALLAAAAATAAAIPTGPDHQGDAAAIVQAVQARFDHLADTRRIIESGPTTAELVAVLGSGKVLMDSLRTQVTQMNSGSTALAAELRAGINSLQSRIGIVQISGLLFGVLAGLVGIALFTNGISRRLGVAADNADRLGQGQSLLPVPPAEDELGRLSDSLRTAHVVLAVRMAELSAARDQAVRATDAKNTFLSRTSHELRTPLNAILGFAQLLELSELDDDDEEAVGHIVQAGRHLLALINELIDTSQIESGELRLSVEPVRIDVVVAEVVALIGPLAAPRAITVQSKGNSALAVQADRQRLKQILVNLASNAVKYNRHGGSITITAQPASDDQAATHDVEISVLDTGPGLTPDEISRIFVPFERLEAGQHGIEGTGIGLPLAQALAQAMRGSLTVTSTPGSGSAFTVRLPQAPDIEPDTDIAPTARARAERRDVGAGSTKPFVVLSIEDNQANSLLLQRFFTGRCDTAFFSADSARAGLELAHRHLPDLVLLDLHLPDLPGEEVIARLRAEPPTASVPIVVLSADATVGTIRRLRSRGVSAYLTKPLDLAELESALERLTADRAGPVVTPSP